MPSCRDLLRGSLRDVQNEWGNVAEQVKRRRLEQRLSQRGAADAAGISPTTWQSLELHCKPVNDLTKEGIAAALHWPSDAVDRILDGEDPATFADVAPDDDPPPWDQLLAQMESVTQTLERLADLVERRGALD